MNDFGFAINTKAPGLLAIVATIEGSVEFEDTNIENEGKNIIIATFDLNNPPTPRTATVVAEIVNGFLVGIDILDSGYGYTSPQLSPSLVEVGQERELLRLSARAG